MMSEQGEPDTFELPCHKHEPNIETKLEAHLKEYESQFAWDETSWYSTPKKMSIDTGNSEPVSPKPYPIAMKHYQWVKDEIEKLLLEWSEEEDQVGQHNNSHIKRRWRKMSSDQLLSSQQGDKEVHLAYPKSRRYLLPTKQCKVFSTLDLRAGYHHIPLDEESIPKTAFTSPFGKYEYIKVPFGTHTSSSILPGTDDRNIEGF